jgi:hypothetical protein
MADVRFMYNEMMEQRKTVDSLCTNMNSVKINFDYLDNVINGLKGDISSLQNFRNLYSPDICAALAKADLALERTVDNSNIENILIERINAMEARLAKIESQLAKQNSKK